MALFGKETTEEKKAPETKDEPRAAKKAVKTSKKELSAKESALAARLLTRPRITEKAYALNTLNQYVFVVSKDATKQSVKRAVEEAYGVAVKAVRMVRLPSRTKRFGKTMGQKGAVKKAIVSVESGQSIELFKAGI